MENTMHITARRAALSTCWAAVIIAACLLLAALLGGCGTNTASSEASAHPTAAAAASSAASAASSALANPTVSADLTRLENELLANLKTEYAKTPAHPVRVARAAVQDTFPQGDTAKISQYAVQEFTPAVITSSGPGSARQAWAAKVAAYALAQGATPAPSATGSQA